MDMAITIQLLKALYVPLTLTLNQARQYMASEIARACNLPEYYVGGNAGGSMTYSNVTAERRRERSATFQ